MNYSADNIFRPLPKLVKAALVYYPATTRLGPQPVVKLAGGALRDILHCRAAKDYDLWVNCPYLYRELQYLFKNLPRTQVANLSYDTERVSVTSYECNGFGIDLILYSGPEDKLLDSFDYPINCHELYVAWDSSKGQRELVLNSKDGWDHKDQRNMRAELWRLPTDLVSVLPQPPAREVQRHKYLSDKFPQYNFHLY